MKMVPEFAVRLAEDTASHYRAESNFWFGKSFGRINAIHKMRLELFMSLAANVLLLGGIAGIAMFVIKAALPARVVLGLSYLGLAALAARRLSKLFGEDE